jgi:hypothetical protein
VSSALDARYGRTPSRRRAARWWAIAVAIAVAVVVALWAGWVGLLGPAASVESDTTGFTILSDSEVEVEYQVSVAPGATAACAVEALSEQYAIIGWKVVEVPASTERTRAFTEIIRTAEPAVTGLIYHCWLT